jgi:hypothetical protein
LVDPDRTLKDFEDEKIGVRVTRANYRTGRLEVSAYISLQQFAIFMKKQAWRLQAYGAEKIPLGSFRLQVPGNPNAINAGICSGRFPGVFAPYPIDYLYPENDPENILLYHILTDWLQSKEVESSLKHAASELNLSDKWDAMYANWQNSKDMRDFFPKKGDFYVDGGAIDNTPSNSAVDFAREQLEREGIGRREASLELFIIYLETEPKVEPEEIKDPALYQVINRTLAIQGAAKGSSDANTVQTINAYGQRSEDLAVVLKALMDSLKSITPELNQPQKRHLEQLLYTQAKQSRWDEVRGKGPEDILTRLEAWTNQMMDLKLPLEVNEIKIYPVEMPMGTLQFTERLGYRKENAIKMLTMGCYDTLWALRNNLESQGKYSLDAQDIKSLSLTRKWMGFDQWPSESSTQELVKKTWLCQREKCVYYSQFCAHGAKLVK